MRFAPRQTIETREPTISVDPGLAPGRHLFQLEVFDDAGNRSKPDVATVEIQSELVRPIRVDPVIRAPFAAVDPAATVEPAPAPTEPDRTR
jgi:hypothetical protein